MRNILEFRLLPVASILVLTLYAGAASGQGVKDTMLNEVSVRGKHKVSNDLRVSEFSPGQKVVSIDSATLQQYQLQNIASLLSQQEPVFVKSYGFNGVATLNFRGSSAAQSQVLWNGVPIQNAALGLADVSSLPIMMMNKVSIVYGGSSALLGSGNVGGALLLEDELPVFHSRDSNSNRLSLCLGGGSFSQFMGGFSGSTSGKRWYISGSGFGQMGADNFKYTNSQGAQMRMENDSIRALSGMIRAAYKIADKHTLSVSAWYQRNIREIPPALFETSSDKKQKDNTIRLLLDWNRQTDKDTWYARSSFIRDEVEYSYRAVQLHTDNVAYQYYQEAGWKKQFQQYGQLLLFMPLQIGWINLPDSNKTKHQDRVALAGAYDYKCFSNRLDVAVNVRAEYIGGQYMAAKQTVFLPGADASFAVLDWLTIRVNAQRTYRAPTLNELYFRPGGNASLRPEQGWSEDAGYTVKAKWRDLTFYHDLSVYNRNIHDWILWLGGAIWTPHNIAEVHSRGVETANNITYSISKWKFHLGINTAYVLATTVSSYIYNDGSVGRQIPYTPRYNGQLNIGFNYSGFSFNYNHTYSGYRFTTTDESSYLLPYATGNLQMMYRTAIHRHEWQFTGQCNNIWNEQYQVVASRPMPGLNWLGGIKVQLF